MEQTYLLQKRIIRIIYKQWTTAAHTITDFLVLQVHLLYKMLLIAHKTFYST